MFNFIHQLRFLIKTSMFVLELILSLFLIRYAIVTPNIIVSRQDVGADKTSIWLASSLDGKTGGMVEKYDKKLDHPVSEQDELLSKCAAPSSTHEDQST